MSNEDARVLELVREIIGIELEDGLTFDVTGARAEAIREDDAYSGVRVVVDGRLSAARLTFHVDVNVGDPIWPGPQDTALPRLLDGRIHLSGYPLEMIYAEKLLTAVDRGWSNTRWRDFADMYLLCHAHAIEADGVIDAVRCVAQHRGVRPAPLRPLLEGWAGQAQRGWAAWRRKQRLDDRLPESFQTVLEQATAFGDPVLDASGGGRVWAAARRRWEPAAG